MACSVGIGLLEAWPIAVLIDSVLAEEPNGDWIHRAFLGLLPASKPGQIIGLVLITMGLQIVGYAVWMARMMINNYLECRGTARVRHHLFAKLQQFGPAFHGSRPQGDAIFRLTTDTAGPWGIIDLVIGTTAAAATLTVLTAILLSRNPSLTLAAFAVAPLMVASNWVFGQRIYRLTLESKQATAA